MDLFWFQKLIKVQGEKLCESSLSFLSNTVGMQGLFSKMKIFFLYCSKVGVNSLIFNKFFKIIFLIANFSFICTYFSESFSLPYVYSFWNIFLNFLSRFTHLWPKFSTFHDNANFCKKQKVILIFEANHICSISWELFF